MYYVGMLALTGFMILVIQELQKILFPRKDAFPHYYPFEMIISMQRNKFRVLDFIADNFRDIKKLRGKKTFIIDSVGIPQLVTTIDVENVTYILKSNWENFGKTGPFKSRVQGLLGDGIFNSDGHQWFAHRKTSAHLFKLNKFRGSILEVFNDDLNQAIKLINSKIAESNGTTTAAFDIHDLMHRFTLESISRVAFGISLGCITNHTVNFATDFDYCTNVMEDSFTNPFYLFERYFTPKGWKYFAALSRINNYAHKIIQERRHEVATGVDLSDRSDILTLYLDNKSFADVLGANKESNKDSEDAIGDEKKLDAFMEPTDKNLRDVILNMVIAGRDTTAQALSWGFFRLCVHPEIQTKLREEARAIYGSASKEKEKSERELLEMNGGIGAVSYDSIQKLKYTEAFLMEILRMYPSVPKEAKCVFEDCVLPDGTAVKKGDIVSFMPWIMGRDPDLWGEDCLEFKPERFLDSPKPSNFKFIAFQAGPRICLGQNFAMLEMKCVLSRLLLIYEFKLAQDPNTVTYGNSLTLPIQGGLLVQAKTLL